MTRPGAVFGPSADGGKDGNAKRPAKTRHTDRKSELDRMRAERIKAWPSVIAEIFLVFICITVGAYAYELWWLFSWYVVQYILTVAGTLVFTRFPEARSETFFASVLVLNFMTGSIFAILPVALWQVDHEVHKFAVIALLVGATLNTFLSRTRVWQATLCYIVPNCGAVLIIALSFTGPEHELRDVVTATIVALSLLTYLLFSANQAYRRHKANERARGELEIARRAEAIGRLTGGIAHDFNNLLFIVLGNLDALRDSKLKETQVEMVDSAIRAAERGADLTRKMLRFARHANFTIRNVHLNRLVRDVTQFAARTMPDNVSIATDLSADLHAARTDSSSAESALLNLLLNARDAMPDGGTINVTTANELVESARPVQGNGHLTPGSYVTITVADTGQGIADERLSRIFEPFATDKATGTGLGLAMTGVFMQRTGGAVDVRSELDAGTVFTLYFRATRAPARATCDKPAVAKAPNRIGARLLVVEDEQNVRSTLVRNLKRSGFEILSAPNGDAALALAKSDPDFDLLITDVVMPGKLQGPSLAQSLRKDRPDLPVVFISGHDFGQFDGHPGVQEGDTRLSKPVRKDLLVQAISDALNAANRN